MKRSTFITWEQLRVGGVVLAAVLILAVAVTQLGRTANLFGRRYTLVTYLANASGLREGGQVTVAGLNAGVIKTIDFLPIDADTTRNLRLILEIDERLKEQVRRDSKARIKTLGLLGDKIVDISPGTPRYPTLRDRDTLATAPSTDYEQLLAQASGAMGDVIALTQSLRGIATTIEKGEGTMGQLLTNRVLYDRLTQTLAQTNTLIARLQNPQGSIGRMLDDPTLYNNLVAAVTASNNLIGQIATSTGTLSKLLNDDTLYTRFVALAAGTDSIIKMALHGKGAMQQILTDRQAYDELLKSLQLLNAILDDIRKHPDRYTKGVIKVF
jgi:phospholipid/cholesterol/gamma-HCH transport system substrate-binding protein